MDDRLIYDCTNYSEIPAHTMSTLDRYVIDGLPPGGFLTAVIENDLRGAVQRADGDNIKVIPIIVTYLLNECPSTCWGYPGIVEEYCKELRAVR